MDGTIQNYTLDMAADTKKDPLEIKQYDTNSRWARISLVAFKSPWIIPFGCQIHISVRKTDGTLANATCTRETESTVLAPITDQMAAVAGTHLGELYFLGNDGDIRSQTFPVVVRDAVTDLDRLASSDDFQVLKDALREVKTSTEAADIAAQYATEQGNSARDGAQRANDAADSIQVAVDAAAAAKACESNAKDSEIAAAQTQQAVTDYVEAQKAAFAGYSKRESDSKYANALTETATGEGGVTVEDAWTAPVINLEVAGKSEQAVTTGAQLLPQPQFNNTKNGITVKTQTDGGISITGTATAAITFTVAEILILAGDYTLSGLSGLVVGRMYFQLIEISAQGGQFVGELAKVGHVASTTITIDHDVWARAEIKVLSGVTADSVCYPMLNVGTTALPWEPYTGGAPSPSPDYPQDIISVGTVSTGAQMLDFEQCLKEWNSKYTQSSRRVYTVNALGTGFQNPISFSDEDIKVALSGKVRDISGSGYRIDLLDSSGNLVGRINKDTKSITGMASKIRLNFAEGGVGEYADIMLNAGNTALPWEPYTGGKPSPSVEYPQELEVGVTGNNLFGGYALVKALRQGAGTVVDAEKRTVIFAGKEVGGKTIYRNFVSGKEYTIILYGRNTDSRYSNCNLKIEYSDKSVETLQFEMLNENSYCIFHTDPQKSVKYLFGQYAAYSTILYYEQCGIFEGNIGLEAFEPYPSASAPITLTEPLRGIGDYRDRIMCKDGVWGIEREFIKIIFDGSENWKREQIIGDIFRFKNTEYRSVIKSEFSINRPIKIMCDRLVEGSSSETFHQKECISSDTTGQIYIYLNAFVSGDLDAFKIYLSSHPITAIFERATPTWEPFPDATQQVLNALTTYAGTTHLTITAGGPVPTVTLDYVKDTHKAFEQHDAAVKQYVDNQLANIVAALPTATQAAIVDNQTTRLLQEV